MIRRQPLRQRRRHQQQLIAITNHEVVTHDPSSHRTPKPGAIVEIRATASSGVILRVQIGRDDDVRRLRLLVIGRSVVFIGSDPQIGSTSCP
jgi:hypothetical protein